MSVLPYLAGESFARENNTRDVDSDVEENRKTCTIMLGLGIAQCLGSFVIGKIVTRFGNKTAVHFNFCACLAALIITALVTHFYYVF